MFGDLMDFVFFQLLYFFFRSLQQAWRERYFLPIGSKCKSHKLNWLVFCTSALILIYFESYEGEETLELFDNYSHVHFVRDTNKNVVSVRDEI